MSHIYVSTGVTSSNLSISSGSLIVENGGTIYNTSATGSDAAIHIASGGIASNTAISDGWLLVASGGIAVGTTVYEDGGMDVSLRGISYNTIVSGGVFETYGTAINVTVFSGGEVEVEDDDGYGGGSAYNVIVHSGGRVEVEDFAYLNSATIYSGGSIEVENGTALNVTLHAGATMDLVIGSGTLFTGTSAGSAFAYSSYLSGGTFDGTTLLGVYEGGRAENLTIAHDGFFYVDAAGSATNITLTNGAKMQVEIGYGTLFTGTSNGSAFSYTSRTEGFVVNASRSLHVAEGGSANNTIVNAIPGENYFGFSVKDGGRATNTTVSSGGCVNGLVITNAAGNYYSSGIHISGARLDSDCEATLYDGQTARDILIEEDGTLNLEGAAVVSGVTIQRHGNIQVSSGGTLIDASFQEKSELEVYDGSVSGIVLSGGEMSLRNGIAANTQIYSGGVMSLQNGIAANTQVYSGGDLIVYNGGTHKGSLQIASGGYVYAYSGSTIDFTVTGRTTGDGYLINDLSRIEGYPSYTITVSADQAAGTYKLAQGASSFTGTISIGTEDVNYGSITVNGSDFVYNGKTYSLDQAGGNLTLTIGGSVVPPVITNDQVKVYSSGTLVKQGTILTGETIADGINNSMFVSSGGTANSTTVIYWGELYVSSGGVANDTTVNSYGYLRVSSGGTANSTMVNSNGHLWVFSGGTANSTTVIYWGELYVSSGGVANDTTVNSYGYLKVESGGVANSTTVNSGGELYVYYGGTANSTTVNSGGDLYVSSGGTATNIVENGGYVYVEEGANVSFIPNTFSGLVLSNAYATLHSGTVANSTTVNDWGGLYVSGGVANSTTVNSGGYLEVYAGGTATNIIAQSGARLGITVASHTHIKGTSGGSAFEMKDGYISGYTVNSFGRLYVESGGTANSTTVNSGGYLWVSSGGTANSTTVSRGDLSVESGGTANDTTVNSSGSLYVESGGTATNIVENGGYIVVAEGANVSFIPNTFSGLVLSNWTSATLHSGTVANSTTVNYSGCLYVYDRGVANSTTVNSVGRLYVESGGTANSTTVNSNGYLCVSSGGVANDTTVISVGYLDVSSGGTANDTMVNSGGYLIISPGGIHKGSLQIASGAIVSAFAGSIIDFTVAGRTAGDGYLINDLSLISGLPTYTITVSADQAAGTYKLAQGASSFTRTISIGTEETLYGFITVNGSDFVYNGKTYSLDQAGGNLTLTIAKPNVDSHVKIYSSGTLTSQGRTITGATIVAGGNNSMYVSNGGTANSTTVNSNGWLTVYSGGVASNTTINAGGVTILSSGAVAKDTLVNSLGGLHIYNGAVASNTTIKESGTIGIGGGAVTYNTLLDSFGRAKIYGGATANNTSIGYAAEMTVLSGGLADTNTIDTWGAIILSSGAIGNSTTILEKAGYHIYDGAKAYTTIITSGAFLGIGLGGTVYNLDVQKGASATFYDDSILRGWNDFAGTVTVNDDVIATDAMINFDITQRSTSEGVIVSNVSGIAGASYYITISNTQASGRYYLAGNADTLKSITITGSSVKLYRDNGLTLYNNMAMALGLDNNNNLFIDILRFAPAAMVAESWETPDLGTWDDPANNMAESTLTNSDERKDSGILAIA